ncbi:MAG TPA: substrate-binding domain-containing protein [Usitatibacter sp.]|nr:substrate-binding domain-containing protein [Usitatibacter sp.]
MRARFFALFLSLAALLPAHGEIRFEGDPAAAKAVWATFQRWVQAYDKADLEGTMSIFDAGVVFTFQGGPDQSYADLRKGYEQDFRSRPPGTSWVPLVDEVHADGNLAFVRATWELRVAGVAKEHNRSVDILRLSQGQWRIIRSFTFPEKSMAQLKVMISGGFSGAYKRLVPEFEKASGVAVTTLSGASQGSGPLTIASQLERGVPVDVVILSREGLTDLIAAGRILPGSDVDLASVPIGAAVRAGSPKVDVSTVDAFRKTLLAAKTIAVPGSTSGIFLVKEVFPKLGIADRINVKVMERGSQTGELVASGGADLALLPVSELAQVAGLDVVGRIPDELQLIQVFSAAIVKGSSEADAGRKLIELLASGRARAAIEKSGMDPAGKR